MDFFTSIVLGIAFVIGCTVLADAMGKKFLYVRISSEDDGIDDLVNELRWLVSSLTKSEDQVLQKLIEEAEERGYLRRQAEEESRSHQVPESR